MQSLPGEVKQRGLDILIKNAELFVGIAQILVRVNTGALRDSIHYEVTENGVVIKAGGPTAPYAPIVEAKFPFMAPAWEMVKPQLEEQLEALQQDINQRTQEIEAILNVNV